MAKAEVGEARFSILLYGDDLPMAEVEELLALKAVRTLRKGDVVNQLPLIRAETDEWIYTIPMVAPEGEDAGLNQLLTHLLAHGDALKKLQDKNTVELRMYVQSDYAQMAYCLMPETLTKLAELALPLSVSSLSWGEVDV